jgi:hypothetical protein
MSLSLSHEETARDYVMRNAGLFFVAVDHVFLMYDVRRADF